MWFLLMAFVNWRDLWLRNQSTALIYDPRLIDDPLQNKETRTDNELLSSISINSTNKTPLLSPGLDMTNSHLLLSRNSPLFSAPSISRKMNNIIPHDKKINFNKTIIDTNLMNKPLHIVQYIMRIINLEQKQKNLKMIIYA